MASLALRKWYLDAVSDDGRVVIVYWASLRFGPVSLTVASLLDSAPGRAPRTRLAVNGGDEPRERDGVVEWSHDGLGVRGRWTRAFPAIDRSLLTGAGGRIAWRCAAPGASVTLEIGGERVEALGYAEVLDVTAAPWTLPIRELRWGRAVSAHGSVVWIDWRGPAPRTDVFVDGVPQPARVGDDTIEGDSFSLHLTRDRTLRDGPIGTTALAGVPGISAWAPARFLTTLESKWVSRATFAGGGREWSSWAVHEIVRFPEAGT